MTQIKLDRNIICLSLYSNIQRFIYFFSEIRSHEEKYQHHTVKILYFKPFCNENVNLMYLI